MRDISTIAPMNPTFVVTEVESTASTATIVVEPLEQGYGHTLGNALRRVMLSSLPGHAITSVRISDADHQYTTLEGVSEDILDIILNIKQVRVKSEADEPFTMKLSVKGPATVTAADIETAAQGEVVNPDQYLATINDKGKLEVELTVSPGVGYDLGADRSSAVIGEMPVDALFSPVVRVSYQVEATRVGRRTDYDRIVFQIQTDGTIKPVVALRQAAQVLHEQFRQVFNPTVIEESVEEDTVSAQEAEALRLTVEELDLPTRIANALRKGGFKTVGDLQGAPRNVIAKVKNLGEKSVDVINEALEKKGVTLGE